VLQGCYGREVIGLSYLGPFLGLSPYFADDPTVHQRYFDNCVSGSEECKISQAALRSTIGIIRVSDLEFFEAFYVFVL
jgi:hypothetical protein